MISRPLHYLIAVADHASFTRAAAALHVSQPALSQQIRLLEEQLGVLLLDRSGRTVKPTDAGRAFVDHARRAARELGAGLRAMKDVSELEGGTLRVAFLPLFTTYLVGPILHRFHVKHPKVGVTVDILAQGEMEAALLDDRYDVGVAFSEVVVNDELEVNALNEEHLCLIVGEGHSLYNRDSVKVRELSQIDLALLNPSFVTRGPIDRFLRSQGVKPQMMIESNSVDAIIAVVSGGSVATIMPKTSAAEAPSLRAVRIDPPIAPYTLATLRRQDNYQSAAVKAFVSLLSEAVP